MGEKRALSKLIALSAVCAVALSLMPAPSAATPGVGPRVIRIGVHGPVTGAVPLPDDSAEQAARLYWRWLRAKDRPINGRHVRVVLRNDQTNPAQAVAVCKEMVEEKKVFALASLPAALSDQAHACARYAESVDVPYISLGMIQGLLRDFERYFAVSATYRAQARLLADMFVDRLRARRKVNGIVYSDGASSREPLAAFKRVMNRRGVDIAYERGFSHMAGTSEARVVVEELMLAGVENVFFLHNPMFFIQVVRNSNTRGYQARWTGIDTGIPHRDTVAEAGCGGGTTLDGARFLSPIPALLDRDRFDPRHDRAMRRVYDSGGDTTTWFGWSFSKALRRMLAESGRRLTRARFERRVERSGFRTGILPRVRFRPSDHFGGRGTHVLRVDCGDSRWHTARSFASDF